MITTVCKLCDAFLKLGSEICVGTVWCFWCSVVLMFKHRISAHVCTFCVFLLRTKMDSNWNDWFVLLVHAGVCGRPALSNVIYLFPLEREFFLLHTPLQISLRSALLRWLDRSGISYPWFSFIQSWACGRIGLMLHTGAGVRCGRQITASQCSTLNSSHDSLRTWNIFNCVHFNEVLANQPNGRDFIFQV